MRVSVPAMVGLIAAHLINREKELRKGLCIKQFVAWEQGTGTLNVLCSEKTTSCPSLNIKGSCPLPPTSLRNPFP